MKKIIILFMLIMLPCVFLNGCGSQKEKALMEDVEKQLTSIKENREDLTGYELFDRMHIKDSKLSLMNIENSDLNKIFNSIEWEIKDAQVNNSTALVTLSLTAKDIDKILSKDYIMTALILDYADYVRNSPNAEREEIDLYIINQISKLIQDEAEFTTSEVMVSAFISPQAGNWIITYDDSFINAILGIMDIEYEIDINDICEEAVKNVDVKYDYNKILNLPDSNKTTRSSIKSPISYNEEAYFDNSDYFFQKERYEAKLKVTEVLRGSKAKEVIDSAAAENVSMRTLDVNSEYILFKVNIELVNNLSAEKQIEISDEDFSLLDSNGHFYNNCIIFGLDTFSVLQEGDKTSGYICFTIDKGTTPFLLFKDYMDNTLVFSD